jgi:uncharacterized protein (TIGR02118 family)
VHRITIQYVAPDDPAAFDEHYLNVHVPMIAPVPGVRAFTWSKPRRLGGEHPVYLIAQLDFDDAASMKSALTSDAMNAAADDAMGLGVPMTIMAGEVVDTGLF